MKQIKNTDYDDKFNIIYRIEYSFTEDLRTLIMRRQLRQIDLFGTSLQRDPREDVARRTGMCISVHEDSGTASTKQFYPVVEFLKESNKTKSYYTYDFQVVCFSIL